MNYKSELTLTDSLAALERQWRKQAEAEVQAFRAMLVRLAYRLGIGERIEAIRKTAPQILESWTAKEWERFFDEALSEGWRSSKDITTPTTVRGLSERSSVVTGQPIVHSVDSVDSVDSKVQEPQEHNQPAYENQTHPHTEAIHALRDIDWEALNVPSMYRDLARSGGVRWKRGLMMIFLLAKFGWNARLEMVLLLAQAFERSPNTTRAWLRKAGTFMTERGLLVSDTLTGRPLVPTSIAVYRLTSEGRDLAERVFHLSPVESDWDRLRQLHEADRFPVHTFGVLTAAIHARLRGYSVEVMPQVESPTPPDLVFWGPEGRAFVEVEMSDKENPAKWRNNAEINGGFVALVAANAERRRVLVADIRRMGFPGKATDLATLLNVSSMQEIPSGPFWKEEWQ